MGRGQLDSKHFDLDATNLVLSKNQYLVAKRAFTGRIGAISLVGPDLGINERSRTTAFFGRAFGRISRTQKESRPEGRPYAQVKRSVEIPLPTRPLNL